jgi:hypothetical protein
MACRVDFLEVNFLEVNFYLKVVKGENNVNRSHLELQIYFKCAIEAQNLGDCKIEIRRGYCLIGGDAAHEDQYMSSPRLYIGCNSLDQAAKHYTKFCI